MLKGLISTAEEIIQVSTNHGYKAQAPKGQETTPSTPDTLVPSPSAFTTTNLDFFFFLDV